MKKETKFKKGFSRSQFLFVESSPVDGVGLVSVLGCFPGGRACAYVLVDGAGSRLSEGQCSVQQLVLECLGFQYAFGQSFQLSRCQACLFPAASQWRSQRNCSAASPLLVPGIIAGASVPWSRPVLLAETCQVGACVDPSASQRLVWTSLSPLTSPSASRSLRALVSAPRAGLCVVGLVWTSFSPPCPLSVLRGVCALVSSHCLHSVTGVICSSFGSA